MIQFPSGICLIQKAYTGSAEQAREYLGIDKLISDTLHVKLTTELLSDIQTETFFTWWDNGISEGTKPFAIATKLFGVEKTYILRMSSRVTHTKKTGLNILTFNCVVVTRAEASNRAPVAVDALYDIGSNSTNNFIKLAALDEDGDMLSYHIVVPPANGTLGGTPPNLTYTPTAGFSDDDCFSFTASDAYTTSQPAVVKLSVGTQLVPTTQIQYTVVNPSPTTKPFELFIVGDVWYKDAGGTWVKQTTSAIPTVQTLGDPTKGTVLVASYDAVVDGRSAEFVSDVTVVKWGKRENIDRLFNFGGVRTDITANVLNDVGDCIATSCVELFDKKIIELPMLDTSKVTNFTRFLSASIATVVPTFDYAEALILTEAFMDSGVLQLPTINSVKGEIFDRMFKNCNGTCFGGIYTYTQLSTKDMFDNATFTNLDESDMAEIEMGEYEGVSGGSPCAFRVLTIEELQSPTANASTIGGSVTSIGKYGVTFENPDNEIPSFLWGFASIGGDTITTTVLNSSHTKSIFEVEFDSAILNAHKSIRCRVTLLGTLASLTVLTPIKRIPIYPSFALPFATGLTNLRTLIDNIDPAWVGDVEITNTIPHPPITTGDLTKFSKVVFTNLSKITAISTDDGLLTTPTEKFAFNATSPITFRNGGAISANGGKGADGADGASVTYIGGTPTVTTEYGYVNNCIVDFGFVSVNESGLSTFYISADYTLDVGDGEYIVASPTNPLVTYTYDSANLMGTAMCNGDSIKLYSLTTITLEYVVAVGGKGGKGGRGCGYNHVRNNGAVGEYPTDTNGLQGEDGKDGKECGQDGGAAITGDNNITMTTIQNGTVVGNVLALPTTI